jgi:hypothetical protein
MAELKQLRSGGKVWSVVWACALILIKRMSACLGIFQSLDPSRNKSVIAAINVLCSQVNLCKY